MDSVMTLLLPLVEAEKERLEKRIHEYLPKADVEYTGWFLTDEGKIRLQGHVFYVTLNGWFSFEWDTHEFTDLAPHEESRTWFYRRRYE